MKCEGCGADLLEGAKACTACGREVGLGHRAAEETLHVAKETGVVAGRLGRGLMTGVQEIGAGAKKGFKHKDGEKKE
ncbi:MAG: hypothetical protein L3K23_08575 [Thermoplasmata archaeon]|nr:hypothetical protein [Thermoplasmata archaeon]